MSRLIVRAISGIAPLLTLALASCAEVPTGLETEAPPVVSPPSYTGPFDGSLRLGVVPAATQVEAGGTDSFLIKDRVTGATLIEGVGENASITYENTTIPGKTSYRLLVLCGTEAERDERVALAEAKSTTTKKYVPYTVFNGTCWNVYLGDLSLSTATSTRNQFRNFAVQDGLAKTTDQWQRVTTTSSVAGFRIIVGNRTVTTPNFVSVHPSSGKVTIQGQPYDGGAVVFRNGAGSLTAVNEIPVETYLRRVVPLIIPPDLYGSPEALKAHAITERTRALYNVGRHAAEGFDFYPGEYQPYGGAETEHALTNAAIDATAGMVATFDGQLMDTPYHPASGGWTANSEDVFEPIVPYLRGVVDFEGGRLEHLTLVAFQVATNTSLKNLTSSQRGVWSNFQNWKVEWTRAEMAEALSAAFGTTVTDVTAIRVTDRGTYSRVRRMEFDTDVGTLVAEKHDIRSKLRWRSSEGTWENLSSTLFFLVEVKDGQTVTGWRAYGAGLGHGVGMSQIGAVRMSEGGKTVQEILTRYYTGVVLEQR